MPQLGESIVEATLVKWHVRPGDRVDRGQVLAEVETDKATNEIPAPAAGTIGALLVPEGETVKVGIEILRYASGPEEPAKAEKTIAPQKTTALPVPAPVNESRLPSRHLAPRPSDGRPASPAVRRIAREKGIDLSTISGTGRRGRITKEDVLAQRQTAFTQPPKSTHKVYKTPVYEPQPGDKIIPFSRRRTYIAEHMMESLETAAHVAAVTEIDLGATMARYKKERAEAEKQGVKLSITAYAVRAVAKALEEHPELNATVRDRELILRRDKNIGVAVDTEDGLIVPVIHRAGDLTLLGIARALEQLTQKARGGTLSPADLAGGSFTISNPGRDGNLFGISIIRQPEVAILRLGEIKKRAVVREIDGEDAIVIRPIMYAALSYDHRVIDGSKGNAFLHRFRQIMAACD